MTFLALILAVPLSAQIEAPCLLGNCAPSDPLSPAHVAPLSGPCPCQLQPLDCCRENTETACVDCQLFA